MRNFKGTVLRPYQLYVAEFTQTAGDIALLRVIYNDMDAVPDITPGLITAGNYRLQIQNTKDLNIGEDSVVNVNTELVYTSHANSKIESFLSEDHSEIFILNIDMSFSSLSDIDGSFVLYLYKYIN